MGLIKPARRPDPFGEAADTQFYWSGSARSTPLAQVEAAVSSGSVAVACAGASGSGKTAFLCKLAEQLAAAGVRFIHPDRIFPCNAGASSGHIPRAWGGPGGADPPRSQSNAAAVLLLDDVDHLARAEMVQLREWWVALREKRDNVALVVSCASSAVDPDSPSRRQDLRSMIDTVVPLQPLAHADIEEVIRYRLEVAGWDWEDVFTQPAIEKVAFYAKGTPKRLVQICSQVMKLAEESGAFPVEPELVKEAAHQLFLPNHLREFSKKISLGLVPVPASWGGNAASSSPSPPPEADTVIVRSAYLKPHAPLEANRAAGPIDDTRAAGPIEDNHAVKPTGHDGAAKPLDTVQPRHETIGHDETTIGRLHQSKDASEHDVEAQARRPAVASSFPKKRRLRGTLSVVAICSIAIVTGAVGYLLGQADMKPVEVVRIIPQPELKPEPMASEDGADVGASVPAENEETAPSPASEGVAPEVAPTPEPVAPSEVAPTPEPVVTPEVVPTPEAALAPEVAPTPEPAAAPEVASTPEAAAAPEVARTPEAAASPEVAIAPQVASTPEAAAAPEVAPTPETAVEPVEPESAQAFAATDAQADAAPAEPSPDANAIGPSDSAGDTIEDEETEVSGLLTDWTPPVISLRQPIEDEGVQSLSGFWTESDNEDVPVAGRDDEAVIGGEDRAAQSPGPQHRDSSATSAALEQQKPGSNEESGAVAAKPEEALTSVPKVEESVAPLQRDSTVMRAQALLAQLDLYRGAIDGLFGNRTIAAIREFQKSMNVAETGEVSEALLRALEEQASTAGSDNSGQQAAQGPDDPAVDAAEALEVVDIMSECRGKEAEWLYIAAINRHVLCGGLSAESPNRVRGR